MMTLQYLENLWKEFEKEAKDLNSIKEISELKSNYLGKQGKLNAILKSLKSITPEERKFLGPLANEYKEKINKSITLAFKALEREQYSKELEKNKTDITYRNSIKAEPRPHGGLHPRTIIRRHLEEIFLSMGFEVLDGPHVEDEFHNFTALNIPPNHPARDMQDTFWFEYPDEVEDAHLLRTHTSTIQVRAMKDRTPPFRFVAPGIVFRSERTDASHEMVFAQMEGMLVGRDISISHLIYFMESILHSIFNQKVEVRLRPGFFPFVEPGFELDIKCLICKGKGCSVCKQTGWVELLPCGMIHPNVLTAGNIDSSEWNGFAFGLGLDRLVMMKYGIDDIRLLQSGDLRFNEQFKFY